MTHPMGRFVYLPIQENHRLNPRELDASWEDFCDKHRDAKKCLKKPQQKLVNLALLKTVSHFTRQIFNSSSPDLKL